MEEYIDDLNMGKPRKYTDTPTEDTQKIDNQEELDLENKDSQKVSGDSYEINKTTFNNQPPKYDNSFIIKDQNIPEHLEGKVLTEGDSDWITTTKNKFIASQERNYYRMAQDAKQIGYEKSLDLLGYGEEFLTDQGVSAQKKGKRSIESYNNLFHLKNTVDQFNTKVASTLSSRVANFETDENSPPLESEEDLQNAIKLGISKLEISTGKDFSEIYGEALDEAKGHYINSAIADIDTLRWFAAQDNNSKTPVTDLYKQIKVPTVNTAALLGYGNVITDDMIQEAKETLALVDAYGDQSWLKKITTELVAGTLSFVSDPVMFTGFHFGSLFLSGLAKSPIMQHLLIGTAFSVASAGLNLIHSEDPNAAAFAQDVGIGAAMYGVPMGIGIGAKYAVKGAWRGYQSFKKPPTAKDPITGTDKSYNELAKTAWEGDISKTNIKEKVEKSGIAEPTSKSDYPDVKKLNADGTKLEPIPRDPYSILESTSAWNDSVGTKLNATGDDFVTVGNKVIDTTTPRTTEDKLASIRHNTDLHNKEINKTIEAAPEAEKKLLLQKASQGDIRVTADTNSILFHTTDPLRKEIIRNKESKMVYEDLLKLSDSKSKKFSNPKIVEDYMVAVSTKLEENIAKLPEKYKPFVRAHIEAQERIAKQQTSQGMLRSDLENYHPPLKIPAEKAYSDKFKKEFSNDIIGAADWKKITSREIEEINTEIQKSKLKIKNAEKNKVNAEGLKTIEGEIKLAEGRVAELTKKGYTKGEKKKIAVGYSKEIVDNVGDTWTIKGQLDHIKRKSIILKPNDYVKMAQKWERDPNLIGGLNNKIEKESFNAAVFREWGYDPEARLDMLAKTFKRYEDQGFVAKRMPGNNLQTLENTSAAFKAERKSPDNPGAWIKGAQQMGALAQTFQLKNMVRYTLVEELYRLSKLNKMFGRNSFEGLWDVTKARFSTSTSAERAILGDGWATSMGSRRGGVNDWLIDSTRGIVNTTIEDVVTVGAKHITESNKRATRLFTHNLIGEVLKKDINKLSATELKELSHLNITPEMLNWGKANLKEASYTLKNNYGEGNLVSFSSVYNRYLQEENIAGADMALKWLSAVERAVQIAVPESHPFLEATARGNPGTQSTVVAILSKYNPIMHLTGAARTISRQIADMSAPGFYNLDSAKKLEALGSALWDAQEMNLLMGMAMDHLQQIGRGQYTDSEVMANHFLNSDYTALTKKALGTLLHGQHIGGNMGFYGELAMGIGVLGKDVVGNLDKDPWQIAKQNHLVGDFMSPSMESWRLAVKLAQASAMTVIPSMHQQGIAKFKRTLTPKGSILTEPLDLLGTFGSKFVLEKLVGDIDENAVINHLTNNSAIQADNKKASSTEKRAVAHGKNPRRKDGFTKK